MEKYYKIAEKQLISLYAASMKLEALECGGVDNWNWYGESLRDWIIDDINGLSYTDPTAYREIIDKYGKDCDFNDLAEIYIKKFYQEAAI